MASRRLLQLLLPLLLGSAARAAPAPGDEEEATLADENQALKLKLERLQAALEEETKYSYVVVKGYITDSENVFMETMEIDEAKQFCNANPKCKGFTFAGPEERPEDEVTVTFKAGSKVTHDSNWVSFVKESSVFGALHGAIKPGSLDELESPSIIAQGVTFESICLLFAVGVALLFACRRRRGGAG